LIREVIVVEGKEDTAAIRRAVEADTIETGGSAVSAETIERIRLANERRGVIILTDPDHPGERIRKLIAAAVPGCKHAFLNREDARHGGEIGVEHASPEAIRRALDGVRSEYAGPESDVEWSFLADAGLINSPDAAARRLEVGKRLGIGYGNGKQFFKRCRMFGITREELVRAMAEAGFAPDAEVDGP
jgi:ribonuclease M5